MVKKNHTPIIYTDIQIVMWFTISYPVPKKHFFLIKEQKDL